MELLLHGAELLLGKLGHAVQVLHLRRNAEVVEVAAQRVHAVDDARHVLLVVEVGNLGVENLGELDALHGVEPLVDVVRVPEHQASVLGGYGGGGSQWR